MRRLQLVRHVAAAAGLIAAAGFAGWLVSADEPVRPPPRPVAWVAPATVKEGIDRFSAALYRHVAAKPGNLAIAPLSIHAILAMTSAGARGQTLAEMEHAAQLPPQHILHAGWKALRSRLADQPKDEDGHPSCQWSLVNGLFCQRGYAFAPAFMECCQDAYGVGQAAPEGLSGAGQQNDGIVAHADFADGGTAQIINGWIGSRTDRCVPDIVAADALGADTRLVLVNTARLKARWVDMFNPLLTAERPFHRPGQPDVQAKTMLDERMLGYAETAQSQIVAIPYRGGCLSMVVVVPKEIDGLAAIGAGLDGPALAAMVAAPGKLQRIRLALPRFRLTGDRLQVQDALRDLGMASAFIPEQADLSGISQPAPLPLFIGRILHQATIEVDETGTEAAAASTAYVPEAGDAPPTREPPIPVIADRPFLAVIRHDPTGAILFMVRIADPHG